jgi:predicted nucleic acid-binding Zn ribbon protein
MKDTQASLLHRLCFVCGVMIPERNGQGVYHAGYGFLTHRGACSAAVEQEERVYDRSRGRWRPPAEVRQRLRALRPPAEARV